MLQRLLFMIDRSLAILMYAVQQYLLWSSMCSDGNSPVNPLQTCETQIQSINRANSRVVVVYNLYEHHSIRRFYCKYK